MNDESCVSILPDSSAETNTIPCTPAAPHPERGSLGSSMLSSRNDDDSDDDPLGSKPTLDVKKHTVNGLLAATNHLLDESSQQQQQQDTSSQSHPNHIRREGEEKEAISKQSTRRERRSSQSKKSSSRRSSSKMEGEEGADNADNDLDTDNPTKQRRSSTGGRSSRRASASSDGKKERRSSGNRTPSSSSPKPEGEKEENNPDTPKKERRSSSHRTSSSKLEGEDTSVKRRSSHNQRLQAAVSVRESEGKQRRSSQNSTTSQQRRLSDSHHNNKKAPDSTALKKVRRSKTMDEGMIAEQLDGSVGGEGPKPRRQRPSRTYSNLEGNSMGRPTSRQSFSISASEHNKSSRRRPSDPSAPISRHSTSREHSRKLVSRARSNDGMSGVRASAVARQASGESNGKQPSRRRPSRALSNVETSATAHLSSNKPIPARQLRPERQGLSYSSEHNHNPRRRISRVHSHDPSMEGMAASEHNRRKPRASVVGVRRDVANCQIQRALQLQEAKVNALPDDIESEPEESEVEYSSEEEEEAPPEGTIGNQPAQPRFSTMLPMPLPSMGMNMQMPQMNLPKFNFTGEEGTGMGANMSQFVPKFNMNFGAAAHNPDGTPAAPGMGANMSQFVPKFNMNFGHNAEGGEGGTGNFFANMPSFVPRAGAAAGEGGAPNNANATNFFSAVSQFAPRFPAGSNYARKESLDESETDSDEDLANQVKQRLNMRKAAPKEEEASSCDDTSNSEYQETATFNNDNKSGESGMDDSATRARTTSAGMVDESEVSNVSNFANFDSPAPGDMGSSSKVQTRQRQRRGFNNRGSIKKPVSNPTGSNRRDSRRQDQYDDDFQ